MTERPFAHASEAELARILDYYQVRWEYEPRTFPIHWNLDGKVVESFAPDFYLPELDMYVELTTLKQSLVRKKNRKLRRLRELYPDLRIKLFYAKDFKALMLKYGRIDLAASLSGVEGQARGTAIAAEDALEAIDRPLPVPAPMDDPGPGPDEHEHGHDPARQERPVTPPSQPARRRRAADRARRSVPADLGTL